MYALLLAVVAISTAAILIRLCDAPPLAVAALRLTFASLVLIPIFGRSSYRDVRSLGPRSMLIVLGSGTALAAHFAMWITSLYMTSVAHSVLLVTTSPIFVALFQKVMLGEAVGRRGAAGIVVAFAGAALIVGGDLTARFSVGGDLLALGGGAAAAAYLLAGRSLRRNLGLWSYVTPVYGTCALLLLISTWIAEVPLSGFTTQTYLYLLLLALIPTLTGHTLLNRALGRVPAHVVGLATLGEPLLATILAWIILSEPPTLVTLPGGLLIILGVWLGLPRQTSPAETTTGRSAATES